MTQEFIFLSYSLTTFHPSIIVLVGGVNWGICKNFITFPLWTDVSNLMFYFKIASIFQNKFHRRSEGYSHWKRLNTPKVNADMFFNASEVTSHLCTPISSSVTICLLDALRCLEERQCNYKALFKYRWLSPSARDQLLLWPYEDRVTHLNELPLAILWWVEHYLAFQRFPPWLHFNLPGMSSSENASVPSHWPKSEPPDQASPSVFNCSPHWGPYALLSLFPYDTFITIFSFLPTISL